MIVCGENNYNQLGEDSNSTVNTNGNIEQIINPGCQSHIDIDSIVSFSIYNDHSVFINKNGDAFAFGDNTNGMIYDKLNNTIFKEAKQIEILDKKNPYKFVSAVCGFYYTLYLTSPQENNENINLIYCYSYEDLKTHHIIKFGNCIPLYLYGGSKLCAAIGSDGSILLISNSIIYQTEPINPYKLPNKYEMPIKIAFYDDKLVFALSSNGIIYQFIYKNNKSFKKIDIDKRFVDIAGTHLHVFFVCDDGHVYGYGSNKNNRLGMKNEIEQVSEFTLIESLNEYNIISAFAGINHSIFITNERKVIVCGNNTFGQLLINKPINTNIYPPVMLNMAGIVTFCITGSNLSVIFQNINAPKNNPNQLIRTLNGYDKFILKKYLELEQKYQDILRKNKDLSKYIQKLEQKITNNKNINFINTAEIKQYKIIETIDLDNMTKSFKVVKETNYIKKEILPNIILDYKIMKRFFQEYEFITICDHPNIIKAYGMHLDSEGKHSIIIEYCPYKLTNMIKKLSDKTRISIILEIASAMEKIHSNKIIHRNLLIENILLDENQHAKLSNFGFCTFSDMEEDTLNVNHFVNKFVNPPPELFKKKAKYDEKIDVYAFGSILYTILTKGENPDISYEEIMNGIIAPIPNTITPFSTLLIQRCWSYNAKDRPSFSDIYERISKNKNKLI